MEDSELDCDGCDQTLCHHEDGRFAGQAIRDLVSLMTKEVDVVGNQVVSRVLKLWKSYLPVSGWVLNLEGHQFYVKEWDLVFVSHPTRGPVLFHDKVLGEVKIDLEYCLEVVMPILDRALALHELSEV